MFGEIKNAHDERLDYTFVPGKNGTDAIAVLGHGVTGNKDRPFVVALGDALGQAGIPTLRFSFSGNGQSGGRFIDSNISKEVEDLGSVLNALKGRRIAYVGHSMGGAVGVLRASRDPRIAFLVSLAGMVNTKAFAQREFGSVTPDKGFMWDDENCPLSQAYMDDLTRIDSVKPAASKIKVPWLLIHGSEDDVVPIQDSLEIFEAANEPKELIKLPGSNHVFAGDYTPIMCDKVVSWLKGKFGI
jgi:pimeloyl-ACP methyl ester carboxylesterase